MIAKLCAAAIAIAICSPAIAQSAESNVVFEIVGGEPTGIAKILEARRAEVLERHGGKLPSHAWWLHGVTSLDYDLDGDLDLLVSIHGGRNGVLLKNQFLESGELRFTNVTKEVGLDFVVPSADKKPWIWDFDGDGWLDIAAFSDETKNTSFFNRKGKTFEAAKFTFNPTSFPSRVADLNGDGYLDLADHVHARQWIYRPADGTFFLEKIASPVPARLPDETIRWQEKLTADKKNRFLRLNYHDQHDLDNDGRADMVVAGFGSYSGDAVGRYLIASAEGQLVDKTELLGLPVDGTPMLVADLTGDGAPEILVAASPSGGLYINDGRGRFKLKAGPMTDFLCKKDPYLHKAMLADFNRDSLLDMVLSSPRLGRAEIYENLGDGEFRVLHSASGWDSEPIAICDIDNNELLDVVIGGPKNSVTIYLNRTPKPGRGARIYPRMSSPNPYAVGTTIEAYEVGALGRKDARPFYSAGTPTDATPVYIGLGQRESFDLRVLFPNGKTFDRVGCKNATLYVGPQGLMDHPKR